MKKLFCLLLVASFMSACSSDNEENNTDQLSNSAYKLVRIEQFDNNNNQTQDLYYTYDNLFRLIRATHENGGIIYKYNDDKLISDCNSDSLTIRAYSYNNNNNLVSSIESDYYRSEYSYNVLNQAINIKEYNIETNQLLVENINTFDDENNVINTTNTTNGRSFIYEYDSMKNPTTLFFNETFLKTILEGNNNVVRRTISDEPNYIETKEYEYNSEGYPSVERIYINGTLNRTNFYTYDTLTN